LNIIGMGGYHGYFSFLCFSHQRSVSDCGNI
jgi:hypothetical protein